MRSKAKTKFNIDDIIEISKKTIKNFSVSYEIDTDSVLYNKSFFVTHEPVWYIDIISLFNKVHWPDAYETLVISDVTGKAIYKLNDHGIPFII